MPGILVPDFEALHSVAVRISDLATFQRNFLPDHRKLKECVPWLQVGLYR